MTKCVSYIIIRMIKENLGIVIRVPIANMIYTWDKEQTLRNYLKYFIGFVQYTYHYKIII